MSRTRYRIFETAYPYFMTCTIVGWVPVFTRREAVQILLDSWTYLQQESQLQVFGFVVLENHLHWIAKAPDLTSIVRRFKAHTAKCLLALLEQRQAHTLLHSFKSLKRAHKIESDHQVWQEGSHPQQVTSDEMLLQKLEYIHNNPVKRGYVDDPTHWRYSSARNYARQPGLIDVVTQWND